MNPNIGYHTRLYSDNTKRVCGGIFGGAIDSQTVERLIKSRFTVTIKPSGTAVFVDKEGREVNLYLSVDARKTEPGKVAMKEHQRLRAIKQQEEEAKEKEVGELIASMDTDELLRRLR